MRTIIEQNWLLYIMAAAGMLGILSQMFLNRCYKLLIREASDTQVEKKEFMKKLKMKFRTDRKRSGDHMNMNVFLQRNLMDYRYHRLNLHQWTRLGVGLFLISLCIGVAGVTYGMQLKLAQIHIRHICEMAAAITVATMAMSLWLDMGYKKTYLMTILEDYFCHSGMSMNYTSVNLEEENLVETERVEEKNVSVVTDLMQTPAKARRKAPAIVGIRKKNGQGQETKAQREKRELQENLTRIGAGVRETAADLEKTKERNREILRQMDVQEQERIIRDVLAEFLA